MTLTLLKSEGIDFRQLHAVADRLTPKLRRTVLAALNKLDEPAQAALLAAIESGQMDRIMALLGATLDDQAAGEIAAVFTEVFVGAANLQGAEFNLAFDIQNPRAVRWAQQNAAALVTGINSQTRDALRDIVVRGIQDGMAPRVQAREMRSLIGLSRRDATAADNFLRGMLEDGLDEDLALRRFGRYRDKLLRARAETIARSETIRAANMGQRAAWDAAADAGMLERDTTRLVWIATEDSRVCPICSAMDGKSVGFEESFRVPQQDPNSEKQTRPPKAERSPPAHPRCRCALGLVEGVSESPSVAGRTIELERGMRGSQSIMDRAHAERGVYIGNRRFDGPRLKRANQEEIGAELTSRFGDRRLQDAAVRLGAESDIQWESGEAGEWVANHVLRSWADTSTSDPISVAMQRATADHFGFRFDPSELASYTADIVDRRVVVNQGQSIYDEVGDVLRGFTEIEYERTQRLLSDAGFGDTVTLARGIGDESLQIGLGQSARLNPMSSFSARLDLSNAFALDFPTDEARLLLAEVPRDRIVSTSLTGRGSFQEYEFIVRGDGPLPVDIGRPLSRGQTLLTEQFEKSVVYPDRLVRNADWVRNS